MIRVGFVTRLASSNAIFDNESTSQDWFSSFLFAWFGSSGHSDDVVDRVVDLFGSFSLRVDRYAGFRVGIYNQTEAG